MKYILLFCLFLTGCTMNCDLDYDKSIHYGDRVIMTNGFYSRTQGVIVQEAIFYKSNSCNLPAYIIDLGSVTIKATRDEFRLYDETRSDK